MGFTRKSLVINASHIELLKTDVLDPCDYLHLLNKNEIDRFKTFKNGKRQTEFVAVRILKEEFFPGQDILYNSIGAPYFENGPFISFSHSNNLVAFAYNSSFKIGIDIEMIRPKISFIQHKFISEEEEIFFKQPNDRLLTQFWSGKETLYKLAGEKEIDFRRQLFIYPHDKNSFTGKLILSDKTYLTELSIFEEEDFIISINTTAIEEK